MQVKQNYSFIKYIDGKVHLYCVNNDFHQGGQDFIMFSNLTKETHLSLVEKDGLFKVTCASCHHPHAFPRKVFENL